MRSPTSSFLSILAPRRPSYSPLSRRLTASAMFCTQADIRSSPAGCKHHGEFSVTFASWRMPRRRKRNALSLLLFAVHPHLFPRLCDFPRDHNLRPIIAHMCGARAVDGDCPGFSPTHFDSSGIAHFHPLEFGGEYVESSGLFPNGVGSSVSSRFSKFELIVAFSFVGCWIKIAAK